jgi:hypothetical protein
MDAWGWILVYLVGFTLLQLLLFRYFSDDTAFEGASLGSRNVSAPRSMDSTQPQTDAGRDAAGDTVYCRHCGTYNEDAQTYTFCRECTAQL